VAQAQVTGYRQLAGAHFRFNVPIRQGNPNQVGGQASRAQQLAAKIHPALNELSGLAAFAG